MPLVQAQIRGPLAAPGRDLKSAPSQLKQRLLVRIVGQLRDSIDLSDAIAARQDIEQLFNRFLREENAVLSLAERANLQSQIVAEILGYGPLQELINDDSVTEIMVNGPSAVWIEQKGRLTLTGIHFDDDAHVKRIIDRIITPLGRHIDEASPMVDGRLPDGSRVNAIIPPLALNGPSITIRKFGRIPLTPKDLIRMGAVTEKAMTFLEAAVQTGVNIIISGGTGTGKTTFLNVLSSFVPGDVRIITIEDAAELQLQQGNVLRLETRPPNAEGSGEVTIRGLLINALRMRPDRIIVGECRGRESLDMLQAMNTGHDGCMTTIHANGPRETLSRVETMVLMAGTDLPSRAIREQIASAFDLIIHLERFADGSRKIAAISEVLGIEEGTIQMQDIFHLVAWELDGRRIEDLRPSGLRPHLMQKLERSGHLLPVDFFVLPTPTRDRLGRA